MTDATTWETVIVRVRVAVEVRVVVEEESAAARRGRRRRAEMVGSFISIDRAACAEYGRICDEVMVDLIDEMR